MDVNELDESRHWHDVHGDEENGDLEEGMGTASQQTQVPRRKKAAVTRRRQVSGAGNGDAMDTNGIGKGMITENGTVRRIVGRVFDVLLFHLLLHLIQWALGVTTLQHFFSSVIQRLYLATLLFSTAITSDLERLALCS
jgi:hypothetical protein